MAGKTGDGGVGVGAIRKSTADGTGLIQHDPWLGPTPIASASGTATTARCSRRSTRPAGCSGRSARGTTTSASTAASMTASPASGIASGRRPRVQLRLIGDFNNWDRCGHPLRPRRVRRLEPLPARRRVRRPARPRQPRQGPRRRTTTAARWTASPRTSAASCRNPARTTSSASLLEPAAAVRSSATRSPRADRRAAHLRSPRRHGDRKRRRSARSTSSPTSVLPRIAEPRLQRHPAHGDPGAPVLRLVRLPRQQLLRRLLALRHAGGAEGADRHGPRPGHRACCWTWSTATR